MWGDCIEEYQNPLFSFLSCRMPPSLHTGTPTEPACFLGSLSCPALVSPKSHRYGSQYTDYPWGTVGWRRDARSFRETHDVLCSYILDWLTYILLFLNHTYMLHRLLYVSYISIKKANALSWHLRREEKLSKSLCQRPVALLIPFARSVPQFYPFSLPLNHPGMKGR